MMPDAESVIVDVLKTGGPYAVVLLLLTIVIWRVGKWAAPMLETLAGRHVAFLDRTSDAVDRMAATQEKVETLLSSHLASISDTLSDHGHKIDSVHNKLDGIKAVVERKQ